LKAYIGALSSHPGQFAAALRGGVYPSEFDFKNYPGDALFQVGDQWVRNDEFGNFAAGYAGEYVFGAYGYLSMRAGGVYYAAERNQHGERISGEHWDDRESVPMINAGATRGKLDYRHDTPNVIFYGIDLHDPSSSETLLSPAGCGMN